MRLHPKLKWALPLLTLAASLAVARPPDDDSRARHDNRHRTEQSDGERRERSRPRISLDRAVSMAQQRFRARVVRADTRESGDRVVYVLRLLNDAGRVWTVRVDASTGDMQ